MDLPEAGKLYLDNIIDVLITVFFTRYKNQILITTMVNLLNKYTN